jgi:hypothetical protein
MAKVITFNVPVKIKRKGVATEERQGLVAILNVGDASTVEKFVLQFERNSKKVECLTHFASGFKISGINDVKIRQMIALGHNARMTDRQAAQQIINGLVGRFGSGEVLRRMHTAPILNH